MRQSTTAYVAAEVRAEMGRQNRDNNWLATQLDVNAMWVSRRLRGITDWSVDDMVRIAEVLGIPAARLLPNGGGLTRGPMPVAELVPATSSPV